MTTVENINISQQENDFLKTTSLRESVERRVFFLENRFIRELTEEELKDHTRKILKERGIAETATSIQNFSKIIDETRSKVILVLEKNDKKSPERLNNLRVTIAEAEFQMSFRVNRNGKPLVEERGMLTDPDGELPPQPKDGSKISGIVFDMMMRTPDQEEIERAIGQSEIGSSLLNANSENELIELGVEKEYAKDVLLMIKANKGESLSAQEKQRVFGMSTSIMTYSGQVIKRLNDQFQLLYDRDKNDHLKRNDHLEDGKEIFAQMFLHQNLAVIAKKQFDQLRDSYKNDTETYPTPIQRDGDLQEVFKNASLDTVEETGNIQAERYLEGEYQRFLEGEEDNRTAQSYREAIDGRKALFMRQEIFPPDAVIRDIVNIIKILKNGGTRADISESQMESLAAMLANDENRDYSEHSYKALNKKLKKKSENSQQIQEIKIDRENLVTQAAASELAYQAKSLLTSGEENIEDVLKEKGISTDLGETQGHVMANLAKKYNYEYAETYMTKLGTWEGMAITAIGKYGGLLTVFFNLIASYQSGEVSPYLALGVAEIAGAYAYMENSFQFPWEDTEETYFAISDLKKEGLIPRLMREKELYGAIDYNNESNYKKFQKKIDKQRDHIKKLRKKNEGASSGEMRDVQVAEPEYGRYLDDEKVGVSLAGLSGSEEEESMYDFSFLFGEGKIPPSVAGNQKVNANVSAAEREAYAQENYERYKIINILFNRKMGGKMDDLYGRAGKNMKDLYT